MSKVILITGAGSGIGAVTAATLARHGHTVYVSMRESKGRNAERASAFNELAEKEGLSLYPIELDVTSDSSVEEAVNLIIDEEGRIDVLVNNAGIMNVGLVEGFTINQLQRQMDVNYFGVARMCRAVLPQMKKQRSGLLIHISSIAGRLVFPFLGTYNPSKFAMEALAEAYRYELAGLGIDSVVVEPGPFASSLINKAPKPADSERLAAYGELAAAPETMIQQFTEFTTSDENCDPQIVADDIANLIATPFGKRPLRTVSGISYGVDEFNNATTAYQRGLLEALDMLSLDPAAN